MWERKLALGWRAKKRRGGRRRGGLVIFAVPEESLCLSVDGWMDRLRFHSSATTCGYKRPNRHTDLPDLRRRSGWRTSPGKIRGPCDFATFQRGLLALRARQRKAGKSFQSLHFCLGLHIHILTKSSLTAFSLMPASCANSRRQALGSDTRDSRLLRLRTERFLPAGAQKNEGWGRAADRFCGDPEP